MPVFPLVGSIMTVPAVILPSRSPASIMATPMRSLTDAIGLRLSSFANTVASAWISLFTLTSGVRPTIWVMSSKMPAMGVDSFERLRKQGYHRFSIMLDSPSANKRPARAS